MENLIAELRERELEERQSECVVARLKDVWNSIFGIL